MTKQSRRAVTVAFLLAAVPAWALDPVTSLASRAVSTALDVRSKAQVKNDTEIDATATKALLTAKGADLKGVSALVFAQRVVLAGTVANEEAKAKALELVGRDKRIHSLESEILVGGEGGSMAGNAVLEEKVNAVLTAAKGVHSVNMRWKAMGGTVVLMGVGKSAAEADLAVAKIRGLEGVKAVKSHLIVLGKKK
ncbi:MAG TPA: BON domain-containing protein [Rhodocyclaceae bacterium]|nr:BON domain-containing protein [Rhodocyclaceae bacterium]